MFRSAIDNVVWILCDCEERKGTWQHIEPWIISQGLENCAVTVEARKLIATVQALTDACTHCAQWLVELNTSPRERVSDR